jgi:hypothetical protein
MRRYFLVALLALIGTVEAQNGPQDVQPAQRAPTPDELAFAQLPQDLQTLLGSLPAREALQKLDFARQNLIALGSPNPSPERMRAQVETVLGPRYGVRSASAGAMTFPPLSPLVPATAFEYR